LVVQKPKTVVREEEHDDDEEETVPPAVAPNDDEDEDATSGNETAARRPRDDEWCDGQVPRRRPNFPHDIPPWVMVEGMVDWNAGWW
jgi:hypothetical protein